MHVAIIMDGNRRWARARGLADSEGHRAGANNLIKIVEAAKKAKIKTLTVYALSTENIQERAKREVNALFGLIIEGFKKEFKRVAKKGVRFDFLGEIDLLPEKVQNIINKTRKLYIAKESIKVNIALNYGGRAEIVETIKKLISDGIAIDKINEQLVSKKLYTAGDSDPDLVIRTGGKIRLSNFLLWQTAYSELYFTKKLWPDFTAADLKKAISWYTQQKRNFGK